MVPTHRKVKIIIVWEGRICLVLMHSKVKNIMVWEEETCTVRRAD